MKNHSLDRRNFIEKDNEVSGSEKDYDESIFKKLNINFRSFK